MNQKKFIGHAITFLAAILCTGLYAVLLIGISFVLMFDDSTTLLWLIVAFTAPLIGLFWCAWLAGRHLRGSLIAWLFGSMLPFVLGIFQSLFRVEVMLVLGALVVLVSWLGFGKGRATHFTGGRVLGRL